MGNILYDVAELSDVPGPGPGPGSLPRWWQDSYYGMRAAIGADFPCHFARLARFRIAFADSMTSLAGRRQVHAAFTAYTEEAYDLAPRALALHLLLVLIRPRALSLERQEQAFWGLLAHLNAQDPEPWPDDSPTDPDHPDWAFCFNGWPLFFNLSTPAHRLRRSRNLGPSAVLVVQTIDGVDLLAPADQRGAPTRRKIRRRLLHYDGTPAPAAFSRSGAVLAHDWKIYVMPDEGDLPAGGCPFHAAGRD